MLVPGISKPSVFLSKNQKISNRFLKNFFFLYSNNSSFFFSAKNKAPRGRAHQNWGEKNGKVFIRA